VFAGGLIHLEMKRIRIHSQLPVLRFTIFRSSSPVRLIFFFLPSCKTSRNQSSENETVTRAARLAASDAGGSKKLAAATGGGGTGGEEGEEESEVRTEGMVVC
jgi:hypothetical protein